MKKIEEIADFTIIVCFSLVIGSLAFSTIATTNLGWIMLNAMLWLLVGIVVWWV